MFLVQLNAFCWVLEFVIILILLLYLFDYLNIFIIYYYLFIGNIIYYDVSLPNIVLTSFH